MIHELRERLRSLGARHRFPAGGAGAAPPPRCALRDWPDEPQYEFLAQRGVERLRLRAQRRLRPRAPRQRDPLRAIRSCAPRTRTSRTTTWSAAACCIVRSTCPEPRAPLHCVCVHLALHERGTAAPGRRADRAHPREVPDRAPLVVAGDFNDWRNLAGKRLAASLGLARGARRPLGQARAQLPERLPAAAAGPHLRALASRVDRAEHRAAAPGRACRTTRRSRRTCARLGRRDGGQLLTETG